MNPETFDALVAQGHNRIPVVREILADLDTPLSVYLKLVEGPYGYLFESVQGGEKWGRYSIIGLPCRTVLRVYGQRIEVRRDGEVIEAFSSFSGVPQERQLPSAPRQPVQYMPEADRPQPRKDVERERGMAVFVGRLRPCPVLGTKFIALGHNTVRGAAGAAVLNAELMLAEGLLGG